jgi:FkbM family methyltransferase
MKKIIYDLGCNSGLNIPYYLLKSDLVVAVEANIKLCEIIKIRFKKEIINRKLVVENCVVTVLPDNMNVDFYLHKHNDFLSQFLMPNKNILGEYLKTKLPSKNIISIINYYGQPYYIKIDLEHYDSNVLKELFFKKVYPKYLSVESHTKKILDIITQDSIYKSFKLVDGSQVHKKYKNCVVNNIRYSFPKHSAGPFGNDVDGHWLKKSNFCFLLSVIGFGAKDIHCSLEDKPNKYYLPLEIMFYTKRKIIRRCILIFIIISIFFVLIYFYM